MSEFIYDRTIEDVMYAINTRAKIATQGFDSLTLEEAADYMDGLKGALNISDLQRIEINTNFIAERLTTSGYPTEVTAIKTWQRTNMPIASELERIRADVATLRGKLTLRSSVPSIPNTLVPADFNKINILERIQYEVMQAVNAITSMLVHINTFRLGQGGYLT